jgi:hypothetical protein
MPRYTVIWDARPLHKNGPPTGSTVTGQDHADFDTVPEGIHNGYVQGGSGKLEAAIITEAIKRGDANFAFPQLRHLRGHTLWPPP